MTLPNIVPRATTLSRVAACLALGASGEPEQRFVALPAAGSAVEYLHDGLSAFRRQAPRSASPSEGAVPWIFRRL